MLHCAMFIALKQSSHIRSTSMDQRTATRNTINLAEIAIRSTSAMVEMQIGMARQMVNLQARSAAALGAPDFSPMFNTSADESCRLVSMAADQMLSAAQRITDTMNDLQGQVVRAAEQHARTLTEEWCRGISRVGEGADDALRVVGQQASRGAQDIERFATEARRAAASPILRPDDPSVTEGPNGGKRKDITGAQPR
jgi:hypothetical protein